MKKENKSFSATFLCQTPHAPFATLCYAHYKTMRRIARRHMIMRRFRDTATHNTDTTETRKNNHSFTDFNSDIISSWVDQQTDVTGVSTGWKGLDNLYRVRFLVREQMRKCVAVISAVFLLSHGAPYRSLTLTQASHSNKKSNAAPHRLSRANSRSSLEFQTLANRSLSTLSSATCPRMKAGASQCARWRRRCGNLSAIKRLCDDFPSPHQLTNKTILSLVFSSPQARDHARQLLEKHVRKPFFETTTYAQGRKRMSLAEVEAGLAWLSDRFYVVRYEDEELPSIDWVLDVARSAVMR